MTYYYNKKEMDAILTNLKNALSTNIDELIEISDRKPQKTEHIKNGLYVRTLETKRAKIY